MKRSSMNRSVFGFLGAIALTAAVTAVPTDANALDRRDIIGGMSAAAVMGVPYDRSYGSYPGDPVYYVRPDGPPPGCVIRRQRVWDGYGWRMQKLRVCH
jgi:hypothetical protein